MCIFSRASTDIARKGNQTGARHHQTWYSPATRDDNQSQSCTFWEENVPVFPKQGLILLEGSRCEASRTSLEWETTNVHILLGVD
jgi:hypothetical protein